MFQKMVIITVCVQIDNASVTRESLSISVRHLGDFMARFCQQSWNVFENNIFSLIIDANNGS